MLNRRGARATAGAMRIGLISNSQTRRNRYISRRLLSIGARLNPLAISTPAPGRVRAMAKRDDGRPGEGRRRSYVDERGGEKERERARGHLVLEPLQKRSILDSQRFITSSNMAPIPSPFLSSLALLSTPFSHPTLPPGPSPSPPPPASLPDDRRRYANS